MSSTLTSNISLQEIVANYKAAKVRQETLNGRHYLVAPLSLIVPGVLNGSRGPLFYPPEEVAKNPQAWNGMPIVVNHPRDPNGTPVSARDPEVLQQWGIGHVYRARVNNRLIAEGWFDIEHTRRVEPRILANLLASRPIELSTGLFTDNDEAEGTFNGRAYTHIARNYRPDHLAVLPDEVGACSLQDGCGVLVNKAKCDSPEHESAESDEEEAEEGAEHEAEEREPKRKKRRGAFSTNGGPGSGNFGHAGRPGEQGGSAASYEAHMATTKANRSGLPEDHEAAAAAHGALAYHPKIGQMARGRHIYMAEQHAKKAKQLSTKPSWAAAKKHAAEAAEKRLSLSKFRQPKRGGIGLSGNQRTDNGGPGSGFFGHRGRPGEQGGSMAADMGGAFGSYWDKPKYGASHGKTKVIKDHAVKAAQQGNHENPYEPDSPEADEWDHHHMAEMNRMDVEYAETPNDTPAQYAFKRHAREAMEADRVDSLRKKRKRPAKAPEAESQPGSMSAFVDTLRKDKQIKIKSKNKDGSTTMLVVKKNRGDSYNVDVYYEEKGEEGFTKSEGYYYDKNSAVGEKLTPAVLFEIIQSDHGIGKKFTINGGAGSGFFGHRGRPGEQGGSMAADQGGAFGGGGKSPKHYREQIGGESWPSWFNESGPALFKRRHGTYSAVYEKEGVRVSYRKKNLGNKVKQQHIGVYPDIETAADAVVKHETTVWGEEAGANANADIYGMTREPDYNKLPKHKSADEKFKEKMGPSDNYIDTRESLSSPGMTGVGSHGEPLATDADVKAFTKRQAKRRKAEMKALHPEHKSRYVEGLDDDQHDFVEWTETGKAVGKSKQPKKFDAGHGTYYADVRMGRAGNHLTAKHVLAYKAKGSNIRVKLGAFNNMDALDEFAQEHHDKTSNEPKRTDNVKVEKGDVWRTIRGARVLIGGDGAIKSGPKALIGRKIGKVMRAERDKQFKKTKAYGKIQARKAERKKEIAKERAANDLGDLAELKKAHPSLYKIMRESSMDDPEQYNSAEYYMNEVPVAKRRLHAEKVVVYHTLSHNGPDLPFERVGKVLPKIRKLVKGGDILKAFESDYGAFIDVVDKAGLLGPASDKLRDDGDKYYPTGNQDGHVGPSQTHEGGPNMAKLSDDQRKTLVDNLISNCGCQKTKSPWIEEDRVMLNALSDDKLVSLERQAKQKVIANAETPAAAALTANTGSLTAEQWLAAAPEEIRSVVANAMRHEQAQKQACVDVITGNSRNLFSKEQLMAMPLTSLVPLAALAGGSTTTAEAPNYLGAAGAPPTANAGREFDVNNDILPLPTMNWEVGAGDLTKVKQQA